MLYKKEFVNDRPKPVYGAQIATIKDLNLQEVEYSNSKVDVLTLTVTINNNDYTLKLFARKPSDYNNQQQVEKYARQCAAIIENFLLLVDDDKRNEIRMKLENIEPDNYEKWNNFFRMFIGKECTLIIGKRKVNIINDGNLETREYMNLWLYDFIKPKHEYEIAKRLYEDNRDRYDYDSTVDRDSNQDNTQQSSSNYEEQEEQVNSEDSLPF